MLRFFDLGFTYPGRGEPVQALCDLNLSVAKGESLALIGPSGSGKSTLLLLACGLLRPSSGALQVCGQELVAPRLGTALILQDFGLLPWKTVLENAALGLEIRHSKRRERLAAATWALERVGIAEFARAFPSELSGGMRQRLALARALALEVDLMLMDEPLSAVDTMLRESLQELLLQLWQDRGYTQLMVTHSIEEAVFLGQRIAVMSARPGRIAALVENPGAGSLRYRQEEAYFRKCREVRAALAQTRPEATPETTPEATPEATPDPTLRTQHVQ
jgi:NitT/TauT family transport system ATP-binding protein